MARPYKSRFLKSIDGEYNYKIARYNLTELREGPELNDFTATPDSGVEPLTVSFDVDFTDASKWAGPTEARIDTGDSVVIKDSEGDHDYEAVGEYVAIATVFDLVGRSISSSVAIEVTEA